MYKQILQGQLQTLAFEEVFKFSQAELKTALAAELKALGYSPVSRKGFLYAPGELPVMLIAHMDTVHRQPMKNVCYSADGSLMMSPEGIGGDDRAGVYMILRILQEAKCHVLFCEDEETGGQGAQKFERSGLRPEVNYLVELDRRGSNDAVFYGCRNREFIRHICSFGFDERWGTFSDISVVAPYLDAAAVNISAGYYNEHRQNEYVRLDQMEANIVRVRDMVLTPCKRFLYKDRSGGTPIPEADPYALHPKLVELMELSAADCLMIANHHVSASRNYGMDRGGRIYLLLPGLDAAVLIDGAAAFSDTGESIAFDGRTARKCRMMELDEALETLQTKSD